MHPNTAIRFFMRLRPPLASKLPSYQLCGELEADESYFGGVRNGKRGRGAASKVVVFGLFKAGRESLHRHHRLRPNRDIVQKVEPDSIVYTDALGAYNALDVSDFHHRRINHAKRFAKRQMRKYNGIKPENFYWFLKECEWRFNGGSHSQLLKQLKSWC